MRYTNLEGYTMLSLHHTGIVSFNVTSKRVRKMMRDDRNLRGRWRSWGLATSSLVGGIKVKVVGIVDRGGLIGERLWGTGSVVGRIERPWRVRGMLRVVIVRRLCVACLVIAVGGHGWRRLHVRVVRGLTAISVAALRTTGANPSLFIQTRLHVVSVDGGRGIKTDSFIRQLVTAATEGPSDDCNDNGQSYQPAKSEYKSRQAFIGKEGIG